MINGEKIEQGLPDSPISQWLGLTQYISLFFLPENAKELGLDSKQFSYTVQSCQHV
jgi:hypothetical protein